MVLASKHLGGKDGILGGIKLFKLSMHVPGIYGNGWLHKWGMWYMYMYILYLTDSWAKREDIIFDG